MTTGCRLFVDLPDPVDQAVPRSSFFDQFAAVRHDDLISCIMRSPDKQSFCDVLPSSVLEQVAAECSPFLAHLFNLSRFQPV